MRKDYAEFLKGKESADHKHGFKPTFLPKYLKKFQRWLSEWSIWKGRAANFCDCGLGKSILELVFGENVLRHTNKPVLIATPLAVAPQFVREGEKFGIECRKTQDGTVHKGINVTNYERLDNYNPDDFGAFICDESGAIKHQDSQTKQRVVDFLRPIPYRLLASATPAPNDYMELGSSSEALGIMSRGQMLGMFFSNNGESTQQWTLKGHAKKRFWRWMCGWARALRKPSDVGFDDEGYDLPPLITNQHVVQSPNNRNGFARMRGAKTLEEQRAERRATLRSRCEKVAELCPKDDYAIIFCHLNDEGDLLERLIPGAVQVSGSDSDKDKEDRLTAFATGQIKVLITKPKIGGWGLNLQHCNRILTFPSHSYEGMYQSIRRCWRFGQTRSVIVDVVTSEGESRVVANMWRKDKQAAELFSALVAEMNEYQLDGKQKQELEKVRIPKWLLR